MNRFIPPSVRRKISRLLGIQAMRDSLRDQKARLTHIEMRVGIVESELGLVNRELDLQERAKLRWRRASPSSALTWGRMVSGDAFVNKVEEYGAFGPDRTILELGPGYGRLLRSILDNGVQFSSYLGIDLSKDNVNHLRSAFQSPKVSFLIADAEELELNTGFDSLISSLTMKHLYPTFESALANLRRFATEGCTFLFDLLEGDGRYFEDDGVTNIRYYTKDEVKTILRNIGIQTVSLDYVHHDAEHTRLLVVAH